LSKTVVLIALLPNDWDAHAYREAIERDPELRERVELRFARGEEAREFLREAEVVACGNLPPEMWGLAESLRWIAFWSAGVDGKIRPEFLERKLLITNASGVHGPNIAEHVMAWMLMFTRRMHLHMRSQGMGQWRRDDQTQTRGAEELTDQTLGIVGLGRIGEGLLRRAKAFDMRVIATKRDISTRYAADSAPDALYPMEALPRLLAESDHVCIALPYTPDTHHLFNAETLAQMKPTAYLYNIARGKIVEETALIEALRTNRIAGAGLDVFETEPLPPDSPLWTLENVLITPHTAGLTPHYFARSAAQFAANLKRYLNGEPLTNLYDPSRGY
jgi:phosphoglycerate dehydrogenase-like enzyme